jgi:hypothetical protein
MNQHLSISNTSRVSRSSVFWFAASLLLLMFMPSSQSLWIDEAEEARYAMVANFSSWVAEFRSDNKSQSQMPLAMLVRYLAAELFGHGEFALRGVNYLWGGLSLICFWRAGRILGLPWLPMLVAVSPFFWFYMNEARPYAMTIFAASLATLGWLVLFRATATNLLPENNGSRDIIKGWCVLLSGTLLLLYTNILGAFTIAAFFVVLFLKAWKFPGLLPRGWGVLLLFWVMLALPVVLWYAHTILQDFGGKKAQVASFGVPNILFAAYEFSGFGGLGLDRNALRAVVAEYGMQAGLQALWPYAVPLVVLMLIWLAIAFYALRMWKTLASEVWWKALLVVGIVSIVLIAVASYLKGSPFWGRHLASSFPIFALLLGFTIGVIRARAKCAGTILLSLLMVCWLTSSLQLRFADRFSKDDYRGAALHAKTALAKGEAVIWGANVCGARYYGVAGDRLRMVFNPSGEEVAQFAERPVIVILSKPDVYDAYGSLRKYLERNTAEVVATLHAFTIYALHSAEQPDESIVLPQME